MYYDPIDPKIVRDNHLKDRGYDEGTNARVGESDLRAELRALMSLLLLQGTISRSGYWVFLAGGFFVWTVMMQLGARIAVLGTLLAVYLLVAVAAGRLRDIGQTPWLAVLVILFLPLGGFPLVMLGMAPTKNVDAAWVGSEAGSSFLD